MIESSEDTRSSLYTPPAEITLQIPRWKFQQFDKCNNAFSIATSGTVTGVTHLNGILMCTTGAQGSGQGQDETGLTWSLYYGCCLEYLEAYQGDLKPLPYEAHWREVREGNRYRCYVGMKVTWKKRELVFVAPRLVIHPLPEGEQEQLSLF